MIKIHGTAEREKKLGQQSCELHSTDVGVKTWRWGWGWEGVITFNFNKKGKSGEDAENDDDLF